LRDTSISELAPRRAFRTVDHSYRLDDVETKLESHIGRLSGGRPRSCGVFENGDLHARANRPNHAPTGPMVLDRLSDRECLEGAALIGGYQCCRQGNGVGAHGHPPDGFDAGVENIEDGLAYKPRPAPVECRLSGVQVPVGDLSGAKGEGPIQSQRLGFQMFYQGFATHPAMVFTHDGKEAPIFYPPGMDLFLIRHGQPDWTPNRLARNDPELTELGHEQAKRVAHRLESLDRVDELWVSTMRRAVQTSDPILPGSNHGTETYDWLQEINNPPGWDGAPADEIDKALQDANLRSMDDMWDGLPGGESFRDFHTRVVSGLEETLSTHGITPMSDEGRHLWTIDDPDKRVIIVAHAGTNAVVLGHLLGLQPVPWEWERFRQPHTGVSRLTMTRISTGWAFSLRQLGDVTHLHPGMVTE